MTLLLENGRLDAALRRGEWFILIGFPVLVASVMLDGGLIVAAGAATATGVACACFRNWRGIRVREIPRNSRM